MNKKERLAAELHDAQMATARDGGRDLFKHKPELMLVEVSRTAASVWPDYKAAQIAYLQGYIEARAQHDAFKRGE